jgi:hypothetical protein
MDISSHGPFIFRASVWCSFKKAPKDWTSEMPSEVSHREQNIDITFKTFVRTKDFLKGRHTDAACLIAALLFMVSELRIYKYTICVIYICHKGWLSCKQDPKVLWLIMMGTCC